MSNPLTAIDGVAVSALEQPSDVAAAGRWLGDRDRAGAAVVPVGGGGGLHVGWPPTRPGLALDLRRLNRLIDFPSEDMTITIEAGVTLAELNRLLLPHRQCLPIDVHRPEQSTLGGALACNATGPRRFGHGTWRDYLLGIDFLRADGTRVHAGGRVVKNVAGYDLMKLQIGAHGSLGVIVQVTLKLKPIPPAQAGVIVLLEPTQIELVLAHLLLSATRPTVVDLTNEGGITAGDGWKVALVFEESHAGVAWQMETLVTELKRLGVSGAAITAIDDPSTLVERLTAWPHAATQPVVFKINTLPGAVAATVLDITRQRPTTPILARAGNGIIWGALGSADDFRSLEPVWRQVRAAGGDVVAPRCPTEQKSTLPIWGLERGEHRIMRALKQQLDPNDTLNPGRFLPRATT